MKRFKAFTQSQNCSVHQCYQGQMAAGKKKVNLPYMLGVAAYDTNIVNRIKLVWPKMLS